MKGIRSMNLSLPTIALVVLLTAGAVGATIFFTLEVPSTVVVMSYEIQFWNEDKTAVVTSFDFGQINPGDSVYSELVWVKNIGDAEIWYDWLCDDLPAGLELTAEDNFDGTSSWAPWNVGALRGWSQNPLDGGIVAGEFGHVLIRFKVTHIGDGSSGSLSFTIKVNSHDTSSG